jgi:CheY-like chemotaxis protein
VIERKNKDHILLVEDDLKTSDQLTKLLKEGLGEDVEIVIATTVNQATEEIQRAIENGIEFVVAILDIKLPGDEEDNAEVDFSVRELLMSDMGHTHVIHITGHSDDPNIRKKAEEDMKAPRWGRPTILSKGEAEWATSLVRLVIATVYGNPIDAELDDLFGGGSPARPARFRSPGSAAGRSLTHRLAALRRNIRDHWSYLDEPLKKRIQRFFKVDVSGETTRISLR